MANSQIKVYIDYDVERKDVVIRTDVSASSADWFQQICRLLEDNSTATRTPQLEVITAPWWSFLAIRKSIGAILRSANVKYELSDVAETFLKKSYEAQRILVSAPLDVVSDAEIEQRLISLGWSWGSRSLTAEQLRNVRKLVNLPAGATFSVPGAGKTTEALAYFFLRSSAQQRLLVVAPKNAFGAWEEQLEICMGSNIGTFVRLRGGAESIADLLKTKPRFLLITYHQFARVSDLMAALISEYETFVFLDESHKIKAGQGRITVDAILRVSHLPIGKLLLSGTPMPQSTEDLVPQLNFLYPEVRATADDVVSLIQPVFVRTTKDELKIPPVRRHIIPVPFNSAQKTLYGLMRSEVAREASKVLTQQSRYALRSLGRSVIRLIEIVSNPVLLADSITFLHTELLSEVLTEGAAPKIIYACERARRLAREGKKSLIWTTFRRNVESIADQLRDLNSVYIHGGIDAGEEDDGDTREGRIKKFHKDPNCFVMVANPAAASEGISLHKVCHHAIYVDRTYNAAHYLQSEDRLHRLGLLPHEGPFIEILQCPGSIDESVQQRLEIKVSRMAAALNDPSLKIDAEQYIPFDIDDDPESRVADLDLEDVKNILEWLRKDI